MTHWLTSMSPRGAKSLTLAGLALIAITDRLTPMGFAHGTLYALVVAVSGLSRQRPWVVGTTVASIALTSLGILVSPAAPVRLAVNYGYYLGANRLLSMVAIAIAGGLTLAVLQRSNQMQATQQTLLDTDDTRQRLESVGQLTGGIAHDFNNLLTVILGNAELLNEMLLNDPRLHPLTEMIEAAARQGAELTQQLLAFACRQTLAPEPVNLNQLIAAMDGPLHRTLGAQIDIEVVQGAGLWTALVDPSQFKSALLNLCLNARDAMAQGGKLTLETANTHLNQTYAHQHPEVVPGQYVMLAVSDTGTGILPDHLEHVFEPFFTTKEKGKGTGLGLSMVYGLMKQSGGHIHIDSAPGRGTSIRLYLPRFIGNATLQTQPSGRQVSGGAALILLVEDNDILRTYAREQLLYLGYRVLVAEHGAAALEIIHQRDDIDLLFTDVVMPGMGGRELADLARRVRPGLRVLYTSGYSDRAIVQQGKLEVPLLSKPYSSAELSQKLRDVLAAAP